MAPELVAGGGYGGLIREKPYILCSGARYKNTPVGRGLIIHHCVGQHLRYTVIPLSILADLRSPSYA